MVLKAFSFGGGVQSTAALVLAAHSRIDYRTFLFCNVGEDSENPETLAYVHKVAMPFARQHGLDLLELWKVRQDGRVDTVYQTITRPESRSIGIPVHMSNGAPGRRACTLDFKIRVVDRWLRQEWQAHRCGVVVGLGISLDEFTRVRTNTDPDTLAWKRLDYPLIDLRLDRMACREIIQQAGLPIPPKSSCWFCPYHSIRTWQELRERRPALFERAVALEQLINERRAALGKDQVYLSRKCRPLPLATTEYVQSSFVDQEEEQVCESGYCFVQEGGGHMMHCYDVALWLSWPALFPRYVELAHALSPFDAVQAVMQAHGVKWVARAAVAHEGMIGRWAFVKLALEAEQEG